MKILLCILLGYLLGSLSPAALISKIKQKSIFDSGTGNLGATNTMLHFGKMLGITVMILDIFKGFLAYKLAGWIAPEFEWLAMVSGFAAVIGHCFPFYLKFKGGKGLAAFGGMILAYNPLFFLFILTTGVLLIILANYGIFITYYAALAFPIFVALTSKSLPLFFACVGASIFIMLIFIPNVKKTLSGQEFKIRDFIKKQFQGDKKNER